MFVYVKYEDGVKEAINVNRIINFDLDNINFDKKYLIQWKDGHFYKGIVGKSQGKPICAGNIKKIVLYIYKNIYVQTHSHIVKLINCALLHTQDCFM